jgi:hypothetical protein
MPLSWPRANPAGPSRMVTTLISLNTYIYIVAARRFQLCMYCLMLISQFIFVRSDNMDRFSSLLHTTGVASAMHGLRVSFVDEAGRRGAMFRHGGHNRG